jgi:nucleotide-binding universal stress UspA family protein
MRPIQAKPLIIILAAASANTAQVLAATASNNPESFNDRFIALGIAAVLLAFAYFRKKKPAIPSKTNDPEPPAIVPLTESAPQQALAEAVAIAVEILQTPQVVAVKPAAENPVATAKQPIGRTIVVPVDFSPHTEYAVRLAQVWSNPNDHIKLVYCVDLDNAFPSANLTPSDFVAIHPAFANIGGETAYHWSQLPWVVVLPRVMEIVEHWAAREFSRLRHTLAIAPDAKLDFQVLHGDTVNQIVSFSADAVAKLIVLLAHKHSASDRLINGSHADKLLHASRIPIIVACEPLQAEPSLPTEILITTDYRVESLPVFLILKDLIPAGKPNLTILTVQTNNERHNELSPKLEALEQVFRSLGFPLTRVKIDALDVETGILDYVKTHRPQLVAMSSHGRIGFAEWIHPSVTKAILHEAGVPILVVHEQSSPTAETLASLSDVIRMITA